MSEKKTLVESLKKFSQKFSKLTSDEQENAELMDAVIELAGIVAGGEE